MIAVVAVVEVGAVDKVASNKKSLFLKIAIVVAIVVVIVGIFIFKSAKNNDQTAQENTASQSQTEEDAVNYPLKITKTDLESIKAYGIQESDPKSMTVGIPYALIVSSSVFVIFSG